MERSSDNKLEILEKLAGRRSIWVYKRTLVKPAWILRLSKKGEGWEVIAEANSFDELLKKTVKKLKQLKEIFS